MNIMYEFFINVSWIDLIPIQVIWKLNVDGFTYKIRRSMPKIDNLEGIGHTSHIICMWIFVYVCLYLCITQPIKVLFGCCNLKTIVGVWKGMLVSHVNLDLNKISDISRPSGQSQHKTLYPIVPSTICWSMLYSGRPCNFYPWPLPKWSLKPHRSIQFIQPENSSWPAKVRKFG